MKTFIIATPYWVRLRTFHQWSNLWYIVPRIYPSVSAFSECFKYMVIGFRIGIWLHVRIPGSHPFWSSLSPVLYLFEIQLLGSRNMNSTSRTQFQVVEINQMYWPIIMFTKQVESRWFTQLYVASFLSFITSTTVSLVRHLYHGKRSLCTRVFILI